jgi:predicted deacylase
VVALFAPPPIPLQVVPPAPSTTWALLGHSAEGRAISVASLGTGPRTLLLIGTIHGDEPQGEDVIARLLKDLEANPALLGDTRLVAVPVANPDGKARRTRGNARGVDLNRNFPMRWAPSAPGRTFGGPFPLSEPESRLLLALIDREKPNLIVSFHADRRCNNSDGAAAAAIAREMARRNGYRLLPDIGYPTPGSLGQQAAYGMGIPIVTLEVGHEAPAPLYAKVRDSLMLGLRAGG